MSICIQESFWAKNYSFAWSAKEEKRIIIRQAVCKHLKSTYQFLCYVANSTSATTSHKNFSAMAHIMYFFSNDPSISYLGTDDFSFCSFPFLYDEGFFLNCWVCRLAWNSKFDILDGKSEDLHVWWNMLAFPFSLSLFLNISSLSTVSTCYKSVSQLLPL